MHNLNYIHQERHQTIYIQSTNRHSYQTDDDVPTPGQRPAHTTVPRRNCKPSKILLQGMGGTCNKKQVRGAGSIHTIPVREIDPHNNERILLPGAQQDPATPISEHISPALKRPAQALKRPEWIRIIQIHQNLYDSYQIYTVGSYKKLDRHMMTSS